MADGGAGGNDVGERLAKACQAAMAEGPWRAPARAAKRRPQRKPSAMAMLIGAIGSSDAKAAQAALDAGAKPEELMKRGEALSNALKKWLRSPEPQGPGSGQEMLDWLEDNGLPMSPQQCGRGWIPWGELGEEERGQRRFGMLRQWTDCVAGFGAGKIQSLAGKAARWSKAEASSGRAAGDPRLAIDMLVEHAQEEDAAMEMMAAFGKASGAWPNGEDWRILGSLAEQSAEGEGSAARFAKGCGRLLADFEGALPPRVAESMMMAALVADSLPMMAALAGKAGFSDWALPGELVERALSIEVAGAAGGGGAKQRVPMLTCALAASRREVRGGVEIGRECARALGKAPEAVEAALARPMPELLAGAGWDEIAEIHGKWPQLLRGPLGNVMHWKARLGRCRADNCKKLLAAGLGELLAEEDQKGQTPVAIAQGDWSAGAKIDWDMAFAKWEAKQVRESVAAGRRSRACKGRRL